jgi:hypothetical protein
MDKYPDHSASIEMRELLQVASNVTGLPVADVEALIFSELDTTHLLVYISAMMSNDMN